MQLNHGELYVLQPKDERVLKRRCKEKESKKYMKEEFASQFKHGVNYQLNDFENDKNTRLVISVCFRQSRVSKKYSKKDNILIDSEGNKVKNDDRTLAMVERDGLISKKRLEKNNERNLNRINKKLRKF